MNRYDEIRATALDIADWVCADPADRNRMADDLVKLCGLMIQAVGKSVAVEGESAMNDAHRHGEEASGEAAHAHNRYMVGERVQDAARELVPEVNGADLERYERSGLKPVWVPSTGSARRAQAQAAADAAADAMAARLMGGRTIPQDVLAATPPADAVRRSVHGSASAADVAAGRCHCGKCRNNRRNSHVWVGALDGDNAPTGDVICGRCGADRCSCTTAPGMIEGPDVDCPSHGDNIARHCRAQQD